MEKINNGSKQTASTSGQMPEIFIQELWKLFQHYLKLLNNSVLTIKSAGSETISAGHP